MSNLITVQDVTKTADNIYEVGRRCYDRALAKGDITLANNHRTSTLDHIEGLKSLMIATRNHGGPNYEYLTALWSKCLDWP